jgi:hypothetical protein
MAQEYVDPIGGSLIIPGSYPSITVAPNNGGLATTGVIVLMGEAESGPSFSEETELEDNQFASDDISSVVSKYKSGPIVDAFRAAAGAAVDPDITNTFSRAIIVKTNTGAASASVLTHEDNFSAYTSLVAKSSGSLGNLIFYTITDDVAEVLPWTDRFSYIGQPAAIDFSVVVDGNIAVDVTIPADSTPVAFASAIVGGGTDLASASGGDRNAIGITSPTLAIAVNGNIGTFTLSINWASVSAGDTLLIPNNSQFEGAAKQNTGWWLVTAISGVNLTATKLADLSTTTGHVAGAVVAPIAITPAVAVANPPATDAIVYGYTSFTWDGTVTPGKGKTFEFATLSPLAGDTDARKMLRTLGVNSNVTWLSVTGAPVVVTSATERKISVKTERKNDGIAEEFVVGGEIGLRVGYDGYSCTLSINSDSITVSYKAASIDPSTVLTLGFDQYPTIADVAGYLASIAGFIAAPGTAVLGNLPSTALDATVWGLLNTSYSANSVWGAKTCPIKIDAFRFSEALTGSYLVKLSAAPEGALPKGVVAATYLTGGSKGGTTAANFTAAVDAIEQVRANFAIPLFSRDATADIADALTDASSTYEIEAINAQLKTHVHKMSGMKVKRNRQAFLSKRDTYANDAEAAANLASHRCAMEFQDGKSAISGSIVQYQPWINAVLCAAGQAGAFYKALVRKQVNVTGVVQAAGDWTYNRDSDIENALKAGLNPIRKAEEGGFVWVSDQTTYGKDSKNFYNSIQMVYAGDIVALTTAQRMERAFVGKSVADVSAAVALSYLDAIMADFFRLKLIAASSDAPLGYKNARIVISGSVMKVSVEVKIAGAIYFIPISFFVTEITQAA